MFLKKKTRRTSGPMIVTVFMLLKKTFVMLKT